MFVQIIEGRTSDAEALKRQLNRWEAEVRPGAPGFLGSTGGVAADGRAIVVARFESEDAARENSDRDEQGTWWAETEKCFDGEPSFTESTDAHEVMGGGSNDAGFVQVMKSTGVERAQVERFDAEVGRLAEVRPDVIGGLRIWTGPDSCYEVNYFTSEAEAREGERKELPEDMQQMMAEFQEAMANTEFIDISDPLLT